MTARGDRIAKTRDPARNRYPELPTDALAYFALRTRIGDMPAESTGLDTPCLEWLGSHSARGYALGPGALFATPDNRSGFVHRWAVLAINGETFDEIHDAAGHLCGNNGCVSPGHVSPISVQRNYLDQILHDVLGDGFQVRATECPGYGVSPDDGEPLHARGCDRRTGYEHGINEPRSPECRRAAQRLSRGYSPDGPDRRHSFARWLFDDVEREPCKRCGGTCTVSVSRKPGRQNWLWRYYCSACGQTSHQVLMSWPDTQRARRAYDEHQAAIAEDDALWCDGEQQP